MTLSEIRTLLASVDPEIKHYFSAADGKNYTYWEETQRLPFMADDRHDPADAAWRFYVHRFTKTENDPVAPALFKALDESTGIAVRWTVDFEPDTGYIHHIFECEGM